MPSRYWGSSILMSPKVVCQQSFLPSLHTPLVCLHSCEVFSTVGVEPRIAATALCHNLTVVTRNVNHFQPTGVRVFDPFSLT